MAASKDYTDALEQVARAVERRYGDETASAFRSHAYWGLLTCSVDDGSGSSSYRLSKTADGATVTPYDAGRVFRLVKTDQGWYISDDVFTGRAFTTEDVRFWQRFASDMRRACNRLKQEATRGAVDAEFFRKFNTGR